MKRKIKIKKDRKWCFRVERRYSDIVRFGVGLAASLGKLDVDQNIRCKAKGNGI